MLDSDSGTARGDVRKEANCALFILALSRLESTCLVCATPLTGKALLKYEKQYEVSLII